MSCGRAAEIDLAAFAADSRAAEWDEFRAHYPRCEDCSRAVTGWSRLRNALEEAVAMQSEHPADAELLAYASGPDELAPARRVAVDAHLAGCAACRTELAVLREFDFAALAPRTAPTRGAARPSWRKRLAAWVEDWLGVGYRPAFALALLLVLAVPAGLVVWRLVGEAGGDAPPIAHEPPPDPARPADEPELQELAREPAPGEAADPRPPESALAPSEPPAPRPDAAPESVLASRSSLPGPAPAPDAAPSPRIVADAPHVPDPPSPPDRAVAATPSPDAIGTLPDAPPRYRPQLALAGGSLASVRVATSIVRGSGGALPAIRALAPEHVGATGEAAPRLYWHLDAESPVPVELVVGDQRGIEPLVEVRLEPPVAAGVHVLDLAAHGVALEPAVSYAWFASLVPDAQRRDLDVASGAFVRRAPPADELAARLADADLAERAHRLADAGYWYDAFDALSRIAAARPESERAAAQRAALLEQVGLGAVAERLGR